MADECDHDLPRQASGLPRDWQDRLDAARATIARLHAPADLAARRALARAYFEVLDVEVGVAALELERGAATAEATLGALYQVVGTDRDAELRGTLCAALFRVAGQRRTGPKELVAKIAAEVQTVEAAIALAELDPALDAVIAQGMVQLVRTGQFQTDATIRGHAFSNGRALVERYGTTTDAAVAKQVDRGIAELTKMMARDDPERAALLETQAVLRARFQ